MNKYDSPINFDIENSISMIIDQIKPNTTILEFGPATGRMTKYLTDKLSCKVYIVEIDQEAFETAKQYAQDGLLGDIEDYEWLPKFKDKKFDYIIFADVLEHLVNPKEVLVNSKKLLAEGGRIITSIPNIAHNAVIIDLINNKFNYTKTGIMDSTHLRFFTYYSLQQLFDDCDLIIEDEKVVRCNLEQAGFNNSYHDIPLQEVEVLKNREFAYAYQFVFTSIDKLFYTKNIDTITLNKYKKEESLGAGSLQSVFIDDGLGFREETKIARKVTLLDKEFNFNIDLSNIDKIDGVRFDPCEYASKIRINKITSNLEDLQIVAENASYKEAEYDVFMHNDPIYTLHSERINEIKYLGINGEIIDVTAYELQIFYNTHMQLIKRDLNEKIDSIDLLNTQLAWNEENLVNKNNEIIQLKDHIVSISEENDILKNQIKQIYNSSSWKITKPIRLLSRLKNKVTNRLNATLSKSNNKNLILIDTKYSDNTLYNVCVSVVIPTYNGEDDIYQLLNALKSQKGIENIEIIVVDSESNDRTLEICKEYKVNIIEIAQTEFSHSYARNLGASNANGDYIIFMTQDALPSNEYWIYNMLTPIIKHDIVAVSCIEKPKENCELAYRVESENFAKYLGAYNTDRIGYLPKKQNYETMRINGQLNDVSCIIIKSIFDQFKYVGDYAEDLDMGVRLIRAGYKVALLSSEKVIHSHNRSCGYYLKRSMVDSKNLKKILPDFPISEQASEKIMSAIIFAYYKTICLLDYLQYNDNIQFTPKEFFELISNYWVNISNVTSVPIEELPYGKSYSDNIVDSFLTELIKMYQKETAEETYLLGHIMHFVNYTLAPFVIDNYSIFDSELKNQIIDTIFKRFVSVCGNELSLYVITHSYNEELKKLVTELQKGV